MLSFFLPLLIQGQDCPAPPQQIPVAVTPLTGEALGGKAQPTSPENYKIGYFEYSGFGVQEISQDARFRDLILDQDFGLRHRCGNVVTMDVSGWNARNGVGRYMLQVERYMKASVPPPGATAAYNKGARPILKSYVAGATWPARSANGSFFLGLMHPQDGSSESLIVAFADAPRPSPALIMARLPIDFDTINLVPELHGSSNFAHLYSLRKGRLIHVVLRLEHSTASNIYSKIQGL